VLSSPQAPATPAAACKSTWLGACGGVESAGLARVIVEQGASAGAEGARASALAEQERLDGARVQLFQALQADGLCKDAAAGFVGRSDRWFYAKRKEGGARAPPSKSATLLPVKEARRSAPRAAPRPRAPLSHAQTFALCECMRKGSTAPWVY